MRSRTTRVLVLAIVCGLTMVAFTAQAWATTWTFTNGAGTKKGTVRTTVKAGRYKVFNAGGTYVGRIVKQTKTSWYVYNTTKKIAAVKKQSSATKPFLATWVAKTQTGWVHKNGDWWNWSVKYANGITHTTPKCIEGACPGAPAAGGAVLLITAK